MAAAASGMSSWASFATAVIAEGNALLARGGVAARLLAIVRDPSTASISSFSFGFLLGAAALALLAGLWRTACDRSKPKRGYGSGENSAWNRRIRTDRPVHRAIHHKLEHTWIYAGAGVSPDWSAASKGLGAAVSATDPSSGAPLTGHLVGRQTWRPAPASHPLKRIQDELTFNAAVNPSAGDKLLRAQRLMASGAPPLQANPGAPRGSSTALPAVRSALDPGATRGSSTALPSVRSALEQGWDFFARLQCDDGHWAGDYGGPMFLMPGLVIACHMSGIDLGVPRASAMVTYLRNQQQEDGGWGLHIEGPSTVFGSTLNYVAARILGVQAGDEMCVRARKFIHSHGGALVNPHWGKFWLAVLGVYEWEGLNPIPSELWLLPRWFPFHPGKMWCHCRMVYLPMSYIYGVSFRAPSDSPAPLPRSPLRDALRSELYTTPYDTISWDAARNNCAAIDLYAPHTMLTEAVFWLFRFYENWAPTSLVSALRAAGNAFALEYVRAEDLQTNYVDIGPVNKAVNMLAVALASGRDSAALQRHIARIDDYLWVAEDGMKMQGYNGSQLWDTAFAAQALVAAGPRITSRHSFTLARIHSYIDASQVTEDVPQRHRFFRTISKGGWPFSTQDHGWPIADCTAEGLKAALALRSLAVDGALPAPPAHLMLRVGAVADYIPVSRLADAVDVILALHNPHNDGGWATYEETRGGAWYEALNPAEVFGDIMVDYTYTELTSSAVQALAAFVTAFPHHPRALAARSALEAGVRYVRAQQRDDGSWYGSWAVCFTYGAWFGVEALCAGRCGGDTPIPSDAAALAASSAFLLSKQAVDGGWGETYLSCLTKVYCAGPSNAVNTAWALLALMKARTDDVAAVQRGVAFLLAQQTADGDWAQDRIAGIFNRTCGITYTSYRNVFPLWALAVYENEYAPRMAALAGHALPPVPLLGASISDPSSEAAMPRPSASQSPYRRRRGSGAAIAMQQPPADVRSRGAAGARQSQRRSRVPSARSARQ